MNALAGFYNVGMPEKADLKELWKCIDTVNKSGRLLEIPVFQTKEQFEGIINKKIAPASERSPTTYLLFQL